MFIRRTKTRTAEDGTEYFAFRLVENRRFGDKVRQRTLLSLGSGFAVDRKDWRLLCARISQLLSLRDPLLPADCPGPVEAEAQRIAAQLVSRARASGASGGETHSVDLDSLELVRPRSAGVEHAGLWAMRQLGFEELLERLGFNGPLRAAAMGSVIGRMAAPGSERAAWRWLCERSALGELMGVDFEKMSMMRLCRASDALLSQRGRIEAELFGRAADLFSLTPTVTLIDLTNTYFEGAAAAQPGAARGRPKEKRSDCPLLTLGLVLDGSGFVRRSRVFPGNAGEAGTLEEMLSALSAPSEALVVMDAGIASGDNVAWLRRSGYGHLVVSRERVRRFDPDLAQAAETRSGRTVHLQPVTDEAGSELRLYCRSDARAGKEAAIAERFAAKFEGELRDLHEGLSRPRTRKRLSHVWQRIGRIREKSRGAGQHYEVNVLADPENDGRAAAVTWERKPVDGTMLTHPGICCLRTNRLDWDAERLWRTCSMLADLESVFRSLKSELGLRPIYHRTRDRSDGHLFTTVLAYQMTEVIRQRLRARGERASWTTLRGVLAGQSRVTAAVRRADGKTVHVRKATRAEPSQLRICDALGLDPAPGRTKTMLA